MTTTRYVLLYYNSLVSQWRRNYEADTEAEVLAFWEDLTPKSRGSFTWKLVREDVTELRVLPSAPVE